MRKGVKEAKAIERVLHKYMQLEEIPFTYGDGIKLTQREIHVIDAIGTNPDINMTQLAEMHGITKGAVSQMIYRLLDKGYVEKVPAPEDDREVRILLTQSGHAAYKAHKEYHAKRSGDFMDFLGSMNAVEFAVLQQVLASFEAMVDDALEEASN